MVGKITKNEKKMFRTLLIMDTVRGEHSTGVVIVNDKGVPSIFKQVGNPYELFDSMKYNSGINGVCSALIGHNRYATKGAVNKVNAHPFNHGDISGSHNGTLTKQWLLPDSSKFNVDSENIIYTLNKEGVKDTIKKLCGAYALTWHNAKDNTVNMVRNEERPLCMSYSKDRKTIFWASEAWMLHVSSDKTGVEIGEVFSIKTGRCISIPVPKVAPASVPAYAVNDIENYEVEEYVEPVKKPSTKSTGISVGNTTEKKPPFTPDVNAGTELQKHFNKNVIFRVRGFRNVGNTEYLWGTISGSNVEIRLYTGRKTKRGAEWYDVKKLWKGYVKKVHLNPGTPYGVIDLRTIKECHLNAVSDDGEELEKLNHVGYNGQLFTGFEMQKKLEVGCGWCDEVPSLDESDQVYWIGYREFLCPHCASLDDTKQFRM